MCLVDEFHVLDVSYCAALHALFTWASAGVTTSREATAAICTSCLFICMAESLLSARAHLPLYVIRLVTRTTYNT